MNTVMQSMSSILSQVVVAASQWMLVVGKGIIIKKSLMMINFFIVINVFNI